MKLRDVSGWCVQARVSGLSCAGAVLEDGQSIVTVSFTPSTTVADVDHWNVTSSWDGDTVQVLQFVRADS